MGLSLTAEDLTRCSELSRVMLSPLQSGTVDDWRREVNRAARELFCADQTIFMMPGGRELFFSEDAPDVAKGVEDYVTHYSANSFRLSDPIVEEWQWLRRRQGVEVFSWQMNERMVNQVGFGMKDSDMVRGVLQGHGAQDFTGCYAQTPVGEVLLWMLYRGRTRSRFGEGAVSLLQLLLPSFKAGLDAVVRWDGQAASLEAVAEPVLVFGMGGRELYRNTQMTALCDGDPESHMVTFAAAQIGESLLALVCGPGEKPASGTRTITTRRGLYHLTGSILPPGAFAPESTVLVRAAHPTAPQLPAASELSERFGLTRREGEVALLLARGASNEEISERLFLSPHTARRHTANIFGKLGVNTRKALALVFLAG